MQGDKRNWRRHTIRTDINSKEFIHTLANKKPTIAGDEDAGIVDVQPVSRSSVGGVSGEDQAGGVWKREDSLRTPQPIGFLQ